MQVPHVVSLPMSSTLPTQLSQLAHSQPAPAQSQPAHSQPTLPSQTTFQQDDLTLNIYSLSLTKHHKCTSSPGPSPSPPGGSDSPSSNDCPTQDQFMEDEKISLSSRSSVSSTSTLSSTSRSFMCRKLTRDRNSVIVLDTSVAWTERHGGERQRTILRLWECASGFRLVLTLR